MTFDGKTYTFPEKCSYYLVKEIISKHNLTITINRSCGSSDGALCPPTLTVQYKSHLVVLTQDSLGNKVSTDSNAQVCVAVTILPLFILRILT